MSVEPDRPAGRTLSNVRYGRLVGLLLLSPIGIFIVASSKTDFDLTSLTLIFSLFAGMILVYGLTTAWSIERLGRSSLPPPRPRALGYCFSARSPRSGSLRLVTP